MEKKNYIAPFTELSSSFPLLLLPELLTLSTNDEEGDGRQLSRRGSGKRPDWDYDENDNDWQ